MIDLHWHTTGSDGVLTPTNIIKQPVAEGISALAIADHDTVDGLEEALQTTKQKGVCLIPAIELSIDHFNGDFHLLGDNINCFRVFM